MKKKQLMRNNFFFVLICISILFFFNSCYYGNTKKAITKFNSLGAPKDDKDDKDKGDEILAKTILFTIASPVIAAHVGFDIIESLLLLQGFYGPYKDTINPFRDPAIKCYYNAKKVDTLEAYQSYLNK